MSKNLLKIKPQTRASCQREGYVSTQTGMSHFNKRNTRVLFYTKRDGVLQNADLRVVFQHKNISLNSFTFQL